jgi:hypothetical protein
MCRLLQIDHRFYVDMTVAYGEFVRGDSFPVEPLDQKISRVELDAITRTDEKPSQSLYKATTVRKVCAQ